ncbi:MAG: bifunctional methylenetetrahydrofolate dehydrogenase/methenyltetrahydrofolate cyclohydrolase FolD [Ignavibacteriales bacterium]
MDKDIDGKKISKVIKENIKEFTKDLIIKPGLAVIQIGDDSASNIYINQKEKACNEVGITFKHYKFDKNDTEEMVINKIVELNNNQYIFGIIVQLPIPAGFNKHRIINTISPDKDVDGLTETSLGRLMGGKESFVSCTPAGIMYLLKSYDIDVARKHVVIIGRSELVGRPLMTLMLNNDATVTICHSKTINMDVITKQADILVVATGHKDLIKANMIKNSAIIIDVGINRVDGKVYGDVDYEDVYSKVSYITPVPGGVGPMTVAMLLNNVIISYKKSDKSFKYKNLVNDYTVKLSDGNEYNVLDTLKLDNKTYLYLIDKFDRTNIKFCEHDIENDELIIVRNDDIREKLSYLLFEKHVN